MTPTIMNARLLVPVAHPDGPIVRCPKCLVLDRVHGHRCDPAVLALRQRERGRNAEGMR